MKKTIYFIFALSLLGLIACNKQDLTAQIPEKTGTVELSISTAKSSGTKAVSAYIDAKEYETRINNIQALIFGVDGKINCHKDLGTSTRSSLSTTSGAKTVYVVINGPDLSTVATLAELETKRIDLSENSTEASKGFIMAGKNTCIVSGPTECPITVSRLAARIALESVTNALPASYGSFEIKHVFLANVPGNQNFAGTGTTEMWYNKEGRKDESPLIEDHIIDGTTYMASCPQLTFNEIGATVENGKTYGPDTPNLLYAYSNNIETAPNGFNSPFTPQKSVLVTVIEIEGKTYYYPVVLDKSATERNTTSTIGLTISNLGSTDPNEPVSKGSISINVTVDEWQAGATYDENI